MDSSTPTVSTLLCSTILLLYSSALVSGIAWSGLHYTLQENQWAVALRPGKLYSTLHSLEESLSGWVDGAWPLEGLCGSQKVFSFPGFSFLYRIGIKTC